MRSCGTLCNPNTEWRHFASPRACKGDDGDGDDDYRDDLVVSRQVIDTAFEIIDTAFVLNIITRVCNSVRRLKGV